MPKKHIFQSLAAIGLMLILAQGAHAQEADALLDILVRKGVLTSQEAEEVRSEMKRDVAKTPAGKIRLSDSLTELKLYGDIRLRYQYDTKDFQADPPSIGDDEDRSPSGNQRSRWRFRLRLNADFKLTHNVFGGVELQTNAASDSANQTFEDGFIDYPIFISKAYLGWSPTEWLTFTGGKVPNPFYTTGLVWDPDIHPTGITEKIAFHKLFGGDGDESGDDDGKDGKSVASKKTKPFESPWEFTLIAGQFIFDDNPEGGGRDPGFTDNDRTTDAYLFQTQLVGAYKFSEDVKLTIAPAWLVYNAASARDLDNNNLFEDTDLVSGATRNLNLLLLPGDVSFTLAGLRTKFYWDFSYNIEGRERVQEIYRIDDYRRGDNFAFLVGLQFGENKKSRDWALEVDYRRTGIGSVDPNLNDSDFADAELNTQGFNLIFSYNLTDFAVLGLTYQYAWQIRDIQGGEATEGNAIAEANEVQTFRIDLTVKF